MDCCDFYHSPVASFLNAVRRLYGRIQQNALSTALAAYAVVLVAVYSYYGILLQFSLGLLFLAAIPVTMLLGRTTRLIKETAPLIVVLLSYEALQGLAGVLASDHVLQIVPTKFNLVSTVQTKFYSEEVTDVATLLYSLHFPLVIISAVLLWYGDNILYKKYTYSIIACSYISLIFYIIAPSAPPWYTGAALNLLQVSGLHSSPSGVWSIMVNIGELIESDKLAAFPSLHAAYIVLFCYFTTKLRRIYSLVSVPLTVGVLFSTIYLGQHFVIDLVAGISVAGSCAILVSRFLSTRNNRIETNNTMKGNSRFCK